MENSAYWRRRVVMWVARRLLKHQSRQEILEAAAKRKPPLLEMDVLAAFPQAEQAVRNCYLLNLAPKGMRICDIPGFILPPKGDG